MNKIKIDEIKNKMQEIEELLENDPGKALSEIEKINPKNLSSELKYDYYYLAGDVYYDRDKADEAIKCYKVVLRNKNLDKEDVAKIYANLSGSYFDKELYKDAIRYAERSLGLSLNNRTVGKALKISGLSFLNLKQFKKAIDKFLDILQIFKQRADDDWSKYMIESTYGSLANSYWKDGSEEMAEFYFQKLVSLENVNLVELSQVFLCKANHLYEKRQWKEALEHYNKAFSLMNNEEEKLYYKKYADDCMKKMKNNADGSI